MSISGIVVLSMPHLTPGHMHSASLTVVAAVWQGPRGLALMAAMERESLSQNVAVEGPVRPSRADSSPYFSILSVVGAPGGADCCGEFVAKSDAVPMAPQLAP